MIIQKKEHRNHDGRQYWIIKPVSSNDSDRDLIQNWTNILKNEGHIIHTFFDTLDPILSNIMQGQRGKEWDYLPLNEEEVDWPIEFIIYEL